MISQDGQQGLAANGAYELAGQHLHTMVLEGRFANLLHFLRLRADPLAAQYEIRIYADEICNLVKEWVPHTYEHLKIIDSVELHFLKRKCFAANDQR